jgi:hypothetical protein
VPRKAKMQDEGQVHADKSKMVGSNGFDPELLKSMVVECEEHDEAMEEIMRKAREACQPHVDEIKAIKKRAAEENHVPKKVFSAALRERKLLRKAGAVRGSLSDEQADTYDHVKHALGMLADMPLGQAALSGFEASAAH